MRGTELHQRVATGVAGAIALLLLVIYGGWIGICLLTAVLSMGMIHEFATMTFALEDRVLKRTLLLIVTWVVGLFNLILGRAEYELLLTAFFGLTVYFLFSVKGRTSEEYMQHFKELQFSVFGLLYLVFIPLYLPRIHAAANGVHWTVLFLLVVWAGDTLAYFVGKRFGRRKLYPEISPKKTLEGAAGGLAGGVLIALLYKLILFKAMPWLAILVLPVTVGVTAQVGDLVESFLKRSCGKKDSGTILPGHGGFLDRFDGVVFSLPVMYACTRIFS